MSEEQDRTVISARLMRIGLEAISAVADRLGVSFHDLDLMDKKQFLEKNGKEVVETAIRNGGKDGHHFENRVVLWVENAGVAGLMFVKKRGGR
jgi:hypothetical protein